MQVTSDELKRAYRKVEDNRLDFLADALAQRYKDVTSHVPSTKLWQALRDAVEYESL